MVLLPSAHRDAIVGHARESPNAEVCGILGGRQSRVERVRRARNVADTPRTRFEMDSRDILQGLRAIDDEGLDLIGFYHSHTHTQAYPSPTDVALWSVTWGPEALCFICSLMEADRPLLRAFRIQQDGSIEEERIEIES